MKNTLRVAGLLIPPSIYIFSEKFRNAMTVCESSPVPTPACIPWNDNWDGLQHIKTSDINSNSDVTPMKRTIILVRHGQYVMAKGDKNRVLTELGKKQAQETGSRLSILFEKDTLPPLDTIIYSTMQRATETYNIISSQLKLTLPPTENRRQACDLIREGAVCRPEPNTWHSPTDKDFEEDGERVEKAFQKYFQRSTSTDIVKQGDTSDNANPNPNANPNANANANVDKIKNKGSANSTLFVCHGNVIRYFTMRALQLPPEAWLRTSVANASITIINIHPNGRVSLQCMGETGHLSPELISFN